MPIFKVRKMKRGAILALTLMVFLAVSLASNIFVLSEIVYCASNEESIKYKETMYIYVFFSAHPGELRLVKNVHLFFENLMTGPPINKSLEAFNKLVELEFALTPAGNKFFVSFNIFFEPSIENETASTYADEIIQEFLRVFDYQRLDFLWGNQGIQESKMWVHRSFGYKPYNREEVSAFLEYKPTGGFEKFVDGLLSKYVPGNSTTGLSSSYWLKKVESKFYWTLKVTGVTSELLPWYVRNYSLTIDVKELLNTDLPIVEHPLENQRIIIRIETNHTEQLTKGLTTYTIEIRDIQPEGYTIASSEWPNWVEIRYEPLFPMDNIILKMNIDSSTRNSREQFIKLVITAIIMLMAFLVFVWIVKKRKGGEKVEERI